METSRDDFIIAIRSAFLKKNNKQRFSLLFLIFLSIVLVVLGKYNFKETDYLKVGINEIVYRSSFIISIPEKYIETSYNKIQDHIIFYEKYEEAKKKLKILQVKKYNIDYIIAENNRLKQVLEDVSDVSEGKLAKVLIDKQSPFLRSIIINKGSKNNILKGMAVLSGNYLVGKVVEVNFATSRVLLLSDLNSKIPVIIEPGGIQAILAGNGKETGIIQYSKKNLENLDVAVIYTSGAGGLFKEGIPVGKISKIKEIEKLKVEFFIDFSQLRFVTIKLYKKKRNN